MRNAKLIKEAEALAKALGKKPEEVLSLCSEMLDTVLAGKKNLLSASEIDADRFEEKMKEKMHMRARRTNGSIKFPV